MNRVNEILDIVVRMSRLGNYDSNVIGAAAEIIAEDVFGMRKMPRGSKAFDGYWKPDDNTERSVQVKAWSEARVKKNKAGTFLRISEQMPPDDLLVLLIHCSFPGYEVLYNGPANKVGRIEISKRYGLRRVIRFDAMMPKNEVNQILEKL